ncbi:hypothetical protein Hanom_Chr13g01218131 [Helianthus anomalus]
MRHLSHIQVRIWIFGNWQELAASKPISRLPHKARNLHKFSSGPIRIDQQSPEDVHGEDEAIETLLLSILCNYSEQNSEANCYKSFCFDFQTRDYLMNLFLPAVRMIVETPQNVAKSQEPSVLAN